MLETKISDEYPTPAPLVGTTLTLSLDIFCTVALHVQVFVPTGMRSEIQPGIFFPSAKKVALPIESEVAVKTKF